MSYFIEILTSFVYNNKYILPFERHNSNEVNFMIAKEYEKLDAMTEISEAVRLHYFNEGKFNTNFISIVWTIPASG